MPDNLLAQLNDEQRAAVECTEGYVRLYAGAGTGKTCTLTYRYAHLLTEYGMSPRSVWCVTFTNKAAMEMKQRIMDLCGDVGSPFVTTFHGFCASFLREEYAAIGWPQEFSILDVSDSKQIISSLYEPLKISGRDLSAKKAWTFIDSTKETKEYIAAFLGSDSEELFRRSEQASTPELKMFWRYLFTQRTTFSLDFDDLILLTLHILNTREDIRTKWQKRLEYILVDEFQDIDRDQYELVEILAGYHHNLFIVGDPDQTIYSFRGARVEYFEDFVLVHQAYKDNVTSLHLTKNYRTQEHILAASYTVISNNVSAERLPLEAMRQDITIDHMVGIADPNLKAQMPKTMAPAAVELIASLAAVPEQRSLIPLEHPITNGAISSLKPLVVHAHSVVIEGEYVANGIESILSLDPMATIAVLYRAHSVSTEVENALVKHKIPYSVVGNIKFFERKEIKDIACLMRLRLNLHDDMALRRIINVPPRGCGAKRLEYLENLAEQQHCSLFTALLKAREQQDDYLFNARTKLDEFCQVMLGLNGLPLGRLQDDFELVLNRTCYEEWVKESGDDQRLDNIAVLKRYLQDLREINDEELNLADFIQNLILMNSEYKSKRSSQVQLMTVHNAKGLEFDYVFVISLNEGIFPSQKSISEKSIEEERRLMYVAMTRARKQLLLSEAGGFYYQSVSLPQGGNKSVKRPRLISRFITEMHQEQYVEVGTVDTVVKPEEELENKKQATAAFKAGDRVFHKVFGKGSLQQVNHAEGEYVVFFDKLQRERTLSFNTQLSYAEGEDIAQEQLALQASPQSPSVAATVASAPVLVAQDHEPTVVASNAQIAKIATDLS